MGGIKYAHSKREILSKYGLHRIKHVHIYTFHQTNISQIYRNRPKADILPIWKLVWQTCSDPLTMSQSCVFDPAWGPPTTSISRSGFSPLTGHHQRMPGWIGIRPGRRRRWMKNAFHTALEHRTREVAMEAMEARALERASHVPDRSCSVTLCLRGCDLLGIPLDL